MIGDLELFRVPLQFLTEGGAMGEVAQQVVLNECS